MGVPFAGESNSRHVAVFLPAILGAVALAIAIATLINSRIADLLSTHSTALLVAVAILLLLAGAAAASLLGTVRRADKLARLLEEAESGLPTEELVRSVGGSYPQLTDSLMRCVRRIEQESAHIDAALITNRTLAHELRALQTLLEDLPDGLLLLDKTSRIIFATASSAPFLTVEPAKAQGRAADEVLADSHVSSLLLEELSVETPMQVHVCDKVVAGEKRSYEVRRYVSEGDLSVGMLVVLADVTTLRRLEAYEAGLVRAAVRAIDAPLQAMESQLRDFGEHGDKEDADAHYGDLYAQAVTLRQLLQSLELIPLLQQGTLAPEVSPFPLKSLLDHVAELCTPWCASAGIEFSVISPGRALMLEGDEKLLQVALCNLVATSIQQMESGGLIRLQTTSHEDFFHLEVHDNGQSLSREERDQLMETGRRKPIALDRVERGAIGFEVACGIVQAHHGSVCIENDLGEGNSYLVRFPREAIHRHEHD